MRPSENLKCSKSKTWRPRTLKLYQTIESEIMIIVGKGGGPQGLITLLRVFFSASNLVVWLY